MTPAVPPDALLTPAVDCEGRSLPATTSSRRLLMIIGLAACVTVSALYLVVPDASLYAAA